MPPTTTPTATSTKISMNSGIFSASAGCAESNGSNETVMISRFATANITMTIASGTRMAMATNLRMARASCPERATANAVSRSGETLATGALLFSRSRISLPVLKNGTDFCATETCAPVRGLRPVRAGRFFTEKAPKPRSSTRSPRAIAATISLRMALTMFSTSR